VKDIERDLRESAAPQLDLAEAEASMHEALEDWRGALRRHVPRGRCSESYSSASW